MNKAKVIKFINVAVVAGIIALGAIGGFAFVKGDVPTLVYSLLGIAIGIAVLGVKDK